MSTNNLVYACGQSRQRLVLVQGVFGATGFHSVDDS